MKSPVIEFGDPVVSNLLDVHRMVHWLGFSYPFATSWTANLTHLPTIVYLGEWYTMKKSILGNAWHKSKPPPFIPIYLHFGWPSFTVKWPTLKTNLAGAILIQRCNLKALFVNEVKQTVSLPKSFQDYLEDFATSVHKVWNRVQVYFRLTRSTKPTSVRKLWSNEQCSMHYELASMPF